MPTEAPALRGGPDVTEFLASSGYPPVVPCIHSSDYEPGMADEFGYYLRRRLGLASFLDYSDALSHGGWFHTRAEHIEEPDGHVSDLMTLALVTREAEIVADCKFCGAGHDMQREFIERERNDRDTAWAWFDASRNITTPDGTFVDYLTNPDWETIGREITVEIDHPDFPGTPLVAKYDLLQYNADLNAIRIPDYKTTRIFPEVRMISCPAEFQTWHYMMVLRLLLSGNYNWAVSCQIEAARDRLFEFVNIDTTISTMDHIIVQKPLIRFCQHDRPYCWSSEGKKSKMAGHVEAIDGVGWRCITFPLGQLGGPVGTNDFRDEAHAVQGLHNVTGKKPVKVYSGEPTRERYLDRVRDWYVGTDEETKAERAMHCPVVISRTSMLDLHEQRLYYKRVRRIHDLATREPYPDNFDPAPSAMIAYSRPSIWAPFYVMSPSSWPSLIKQNKILIRHRDPR